MIADSGDVYIYVFESGNDISTEERIKMAAREYCASRRDTLFCGIKFSDKTFTVERTKLGKPFLSELPMIGISVSHSGKYFVCAVAEGSVGVDVQEKQILGVNDENEYSERLCKIADRFFHPDEATLVKSDPPTRFFEIFTAKESYVKFTGSGFDETLDQISVLPEGVTLPSCHADEMDVRWHSKGIDFIQRLLDEKHVLCTCAEKISSVKIIHINENAV